MSFCFGFLSGETLKDIFLASPVCSKNSVRIFMKANLLQAYSGNPNLLGFAIKSKYLLKLKEFPSCKWDMGILSTTFIHVCRCLQTYVSTYYVWIDYHIKLQLCVCNTVLKTMFASFPLWFHLSSLHPCKARTSFTVAHHIVRERTFSLFSMHCYHWTCSLSEPHPPSSCPCCNSGMPSPTTFGSPRTIPSPMPTYIDW